MSQVTTGATLLSADVRFPEVHELPREEGAFRHAPKIERLPPEWSCVAAICLSFVRSLPFAPLPASSEEWRVGASRARTGWSLSLF
jgi:hypothetical protein